MRGEKDGATETRAQVMERDSAIYLAGLFDGEGCVTYSNPPKLRKGKKKAYRTWNIRLEIAMTCKRTIEFAFEKFGCGHINFRPKQSHQTMDQWRWRCSHRDACKVAKYIAPFSVTKQEKLLEVVNHYVNKK
tara:strand:+ start:458 stop:853 length:396 start_codon:yes stop_codon:yes gene_type:complete